MLGIDFLLWYQKSPHEAIAFLLFLVSVEILGFSVMAYSRHKEKQRRIQCELLNNQNIIDFRTRCKRAV